MKAATPVEALSEPSLIAMHRLVQIAVMIDCRFTGILTKLKAHFWDRGSVFKIEWRFGSGAIGGLRRSLVGRGKRLKWIITACRCCEAWQTETQRESGSKTRRDLVEQWKWCGRYWDALRCHMDQLWVVHLYSESMEGENLQSHESES